MTRAPLRVGFAGTPAFASEALAAIVGAGYTIPVVLTQPNRPKGRGLATVHSKVKGLALAHGLPVQQPPSLQTDAQRAALLAVGVDVLVVAAYGLILPRPLLDWPRHGCLNIHASLLPRWRGAAPIVRAIEAGDATTGISIMQMDEGLDTGAVITRCPIAIASDETAGALTARLATLGAAAIVGMLARLQRGELLVAESQPALGATYARKAERGEARIDWSVAAAAIERAVRAFDPWPAAWTTLHGETLKIWRAQALPGHAGSSLAGSVLRAGVDGIDVACAEGVLRILEVQPSNARRMPAAAFCAGRALNAGTRLGDR
ncbi:MAG: methionyl-tRNA formyltransferase [Casimicrobiaceae bacterium]